MLALSPERSVSTVRPNHRVGGSCHEIRTSDGQHEQDYEYYVMPARCVGRRSCTNGQHKQDYESSDVEARSANRRSYAVQGKVSNQT